MAMSDNIYSRETYKNQRQATNSESILGTIKRVIRKGEITLETFL